MLAQIAEDDLRWQRESEVLKELAKGLTNRQIASELRVSYDTVKQHVQPILDKIGVSDRTQSAVHKGLA